MKSLLYRVVVFGILLGVLPGFAQTFTFGPTSASVGANAGNGTVGLTVSPDGAAWTASSNVGWLTVSPPSGTGSAILDYTFTSNLNTVDPRVGTITVGTTTFNVTQTGAAMSLSGTSASVGAFAGSGTFNITTGVGVTWTALSNAGWLTVTPSGTGSAVVTYNFADTTQLTNRVGIITIGGQTFTVTQAGATLTLSVSTLTLLPSAGSVNVMLTVVPNTASWRVGQINGNWGQISPYEGTGTTELTFTFAANSTGFPRSDKIWAGSLIGGYYEAATISVTQASGATTLSSGTAVVSANAGSGTFDLTIDPPGTAWTLSSVSNGNWLSATPTSGSGDATITYTYPINLNARGRQGTIVISGRRFSLSQRGAGGDYTPFPTDAYSEVVKLSQESSAHAVSADGAGNLYFLTSASLRGLNAATGAISTLRQTLDQGVADTAATLAGDFVYMAQPFQCVVSTVVPSNGTYSVAYGGGGGGCTFAGDGGSAYSARFNHPRAVALDTGNLFILDNDNFRVRRVEAATNIITTVAGNGISGSSPDGSLAAEGPIQAVAIALDSAGNLYLAEPTRLRRVDILTDIISTVAGTGTAGFSGDGGPALQAELNGLKSVAIDNRDNIYLLDGNNRRVRRIAAATQIISTVMGTGVQGETGDGGPAHLATIAQPESIAVDNAGNLYITDINTGSLRFIDFTTPRPPLIITADSASRTYGAATPVFTGTVGPTQGGDVITALYSTSAIAASPVGTYPIVPTAQGSNTYKYDITLVNGTLTIDPAPLSVTANSFVRNFGVENPVFTGTLGTTQNGDSIGVAYSTTATINSLPGVYPIVPVLSGVALPNYTVSATNGTLTINDVAISVARPPRPTRGSTGTANVQTFTFKVYGLAPGQAARVAVQCPLPSAICHAPTQIVTDATGASSFDVTVRTARSLRLRRRPSGMLHVLLQLPGLHKEATIPLSF